MEAIISTATPKAAGKYFNILTTEAISFEFRNVEDRPSQARPSTERADSTRNTDENFRVFVCLPTAAGCQALRERRFRYVSVLWAATGASFIQLARAYNVARCTLKHNEGLSLIRE